MGYTKGDSTLLSIGILKSLFPAGALYFVRDMWFVGSEGHMPAPFFVFVTGALLLSAFFPMLSGAAMIHAASRGLSGQAMRSRHTACRFLDGTSMLLAVSVLAILLLLVCLGTAGGDTVYFFIMLVLIYGVQAALVLFNFIKLDSERPDPLPDAGSLPAGPERPA